MSEDMVRQASFGLNMEQTSVPAKDTEKPQLEKQGGDLFQMAKDRENLNRWSGWCRCKFGKMANDGAMRCDLTGDLAAEECKKLVERVS